MNTEIFSELRVGTPPVDIVIEHQINPAVVERAYAQYVRLSELGATMPNADARISSVEREFVALKPWIRRLDTMVDAIGRHTQHLPGVHAALREFVAAHADRDVQLDGVDHG